jgi:hypothetical protein
MSRLRLYLVGPPRIEYEGVTIERTGLPSDVGTAALERGQARDLETTVAEVMAEGEGER